MRGPSKLFSPAIMGILLVSVLLVLGPSCQQNVITPVEQAIGASGADKLSRVAPGQEFKLSGLKTPAPQGQGWLRVQGENITPNSIGFIKRVATYHTLIASVGVYPAPDDDPLKAALRIVYEQIRFYSSGHYRPLSHNYPISTRLHNQLCVGYKIQSEDIGSTPTPPSGERLIVSIEGLACPTLTNRTSIIELSERKLKSQSGYSWDELRSFLSKISFVGNN
jgi:hypothetical protein